MGNIVAGMNTAEIIIHGGNSIFGIMLGDFRLEILFNTGLRPPFFRIITEIRAKRMYLLTMFSSALMLLTRSFSRGRTFFKQYIACPQPSVLSLG